MKSLILIAIKLYQYTLSPFLGGHCRFYPSCSQYSIDCFHHYPWWKASAKTIYRILRCNPWSRGGHDPA